MERPKSPTARRAHRILGIVLLLPLIGWAFTGFVFFLKPGYEAAYRPLRVREVPLEPIAIPAPSGGWLEMRALQTILGGALLVRTDKGWSHLDLATARPLPLPQDASIRRLVEDAIAGDASRYGSIETIVRREGEAPSASITTTTGVTIDLDWSTLALAQSGRDTRRIDALYRIHYLQWTGVTWLDRVLGVSGLTSILVLSGLGVRLAFGRPR